MAERLRMLRSDPVNVSFPRVGSQPLNFSNARNSFVRSLERPGPVRAQRAQPQIFPEFVDAVAHQESGRPQGRARPPGGPQQHSDVPGSGELVELRCVPTHRINTETYTQLVSEE